MLFKDILRYLREDKGVSQKTLADTCKISPTCICQLETGQRNPTGSTLIALADFFECSIDYLVGRSDDFGNITFDSSPAPALTPEESNLLSDFRSLPRQEKAQASEYVHYLAQRRGQAKKA